MVAIYKKTQGSFSGGVLQGMEDNEFLNRAQVSLSKLDNMYVNHNGSVSNRPGFRTYLTSENIVRLESFYANVTDGALIGFKDQEIKIWSEINNALQAHTITGDSPTYTTAEIKDLSITQSGDYVIIAHVDHNVASLKRTATTTWEFSNNFLGTGLVEDPAPTKSSQEPVQWSSGSYAKGSIVKKDGHVWQAVGATAEAPSSSAVEWAVMGSVSTTRTYLITAVTIEGEMTGGALFEEVTSVGTVLTRSAVTGALEYKVYRSIGSDKSSWGLVNVLTPPESGEIKYTTDSVIEHLNTDEVPPTTLEELTTEDNRPGVVAVQQQRLLLAGTNTSPKTVWGSGISRFKDFHKRSVPTASTPFKYDIASGGNDIIKHMIPYNTLVLFSASEETEVSDSKGYNNISAIDINVSKQTSFGATSTKPEIVESDIIFAPASGDRVMSYGYYRNRNSYMATDLTVIVRDYFEGKKVLKICWQRTPVSAVWVLLDDGTLKSMTYFSASDEVKVQAWSSHFIKDGTIKDITVLRSGSVDDLWAVVEHESIYKLQKLSRRVDDIDKYVGLDNAYVYEYEDPRTTGTTEAITNFANKTKEAIIDGFHVKELVFNGDGVATLPAGYESGYSRIVIGDHIQATMATLPETKIKGGLRESSVGTTISIPEVVIRYKNSLGGEVSLRSSYGVSNPLAQKLIKNGVVPYKNTLETGLKKVSFDGSTISEDNLIEITQKIPYPITIKSITKTLKVVT